MATTQEIVSVFTTKINSAFIQGFSSVGERPLIEPAVSVIPVESRNVNLPFITPPPMMSEFLGARQYGSLSEYNYLVKVKTWSQAGRIRYEDMEDDQSGGFKLRFSEMGETAKDFKYIALMQHLAGGQTYTAFDGRAAFVSRTDGTSGAVGTYNNLFTATTAASDTTHCAVFLIKSGKLKPLVWLDREPAALKTDAGTIESEKVREVKYFATMRGAPAFGNPWDMVMVKFTGTPTVAEFQTALGTVKTRFRQAKLPKSLGTDTDQYFHVNKQFSDKNLMCVVSTGLEQIAQQAFHLSLISSTENVYKGFAELATSGYLDSVV